MLSTTAEHADAFTTASVVVFRRLPQWTRKELVSADRAAKSLMAGIAWE